MLIVDWDVDVDAVEGMAIWMAVYPPTQCQVVGG